MDSPGKPPRRGERDPVEQPEALTQSACFELLRGVEVGRLAVRLTEGGVDIFPVNFIVDAGTILLRTAAGTKLNSIEEEPSVAFEADHFDWYERTAWSVVVKGEASRITDHNELFELFGVELDPWQHERKPFFVRIVPTMTSGRRFTVQRRAAP